MGWGMNFSELGVSEFGLLCRTMRNGGYLLLLPPPPPIPPSSPLRERDQGKVKGREERKGIEIIGNVTKLIAQEKKTSAH